MSRLVEDHPRIDAEKCLLIAENNSSEIDNNNHYQRAFRIATWYSQLTRMFVRLLSGLRTKWPLTLTVTALVYGAGFIFGIKISQDLDGAFDAAHSISYCKLIKNALSDPLLCGTAILTAS